uniref:Metalloendopeptidase n=1 Tax=Labrus bergylta TaxID=56723 RepID=A0A3Q3EGP3_9LABR
MIPSASLLLLLLLGLSQALPLQEEGSAEEEEEVPDGVDITTRILTSNNGTDEILLEGDLLALPLQEEGSAEEEEEVPDGVDITTRILTSNNGTDEILLEGDLLAPKTRNAMMCWSQSCLWKKTSNGLRQKIDYAMKGFHRKTSPLQQSGMFLQSGRTGGRQVLSLNRQGCLYHGIIQHEINHALGFQHEQSRSDRDNYVRINWENIDPQMAGNFHRESTNNLNTPYDYSSIMHYGRTAFSIQYGKDSITPIPDPNVQIGQRKGMSYWDIMRINLLYSCK